MLINLCIVKLQARTNEQKYNLLYYGQMDTIMVNTQSLRTKLVMENIYKRRSKQTGMSVYQIKNCYNSKIKKPIKV